MAIATSRAPWALYSGYKWEWTGRELVLCLWRPASMLQHSRIRVLQNAVMGSVIEARLRGVTQLFPLVADWVKL